MAPGEFDNPPSIPQYPEMIMKAIDALNEPNGSNESSISKHILSTYGDLPEAHSTLLSNHLTKLKRSGDLVLVKNKYTKPDPNALPKRGRGRPPKPKDLSPVESAPAGPPRPRGRPPKARDPLAPISHPKKVSVGTGRPRGRPPKDKEGGISVAPVGPPRGRGRPPKVKPAVAAVGC